jgi:hypothetical protein
MQRCSLVLGLVGIIPKHWLSIIGDRPIPLVSTRNRPRPFKSQYLRLNGAPCAAIKRLARAPLRLAGKEREQQ